MKDTLLTELQHLANKNLKLGYDLPDGSWVSKWRAQSKVTLAKACSAVELGQPDSLPLENFRLLATAMNVERLFSSDMKS